MTIHLYNIRAVTINLIFLWFFFFLLYIHKQSNLMLFAFIHPSKTLSGVSMTLWCFFIVYSSPVKFPYWYIHSAILTEGLLGAKQVWGCRDITMETDTSACPYGTYILVMSLWHISWESTLCRKCRWCRITPTFSLSFAHISSIF